MIIPQAWVEFEFEEQGGEEMLPPFSPQSQPLNPKQYTQPHISFGTEAL